LMAIAQALRSHAISILNFPSSSLLDQDESPFIRYYGPPNSVHYLY
jgi:hypothetical protein